MPNITNPITELPIKDLYQLGLSKEATPQELHWIAEHIIHNLPNAYADLAEHIAESESAQTETLELLAQSRYYRVLENVAKNPNTPLRTLKKLYSSYDYADDSIKAAVASNPNIDDEIKDAIIDSDSEDAKYALSWNPSLTKLDFDILSDDRDSYIREQVANNPNTPYYLLKKLLGDKSESVIGAAITNKNLPEEFIVELMNKGSLKQKKVILREFNYQNPKLAEDFQWRVINSDDSDLIGYLAELPALSPEILDTLISREEMIILFKLINNNRKLTDVDVINIVKTAFKIKDSSGLFYSVLKDVFRHYKLNESTLKLMLDSGVFKDESPDREDQNNVFSKIVKELKNKNNIKQAYEDTSEDIIYRNLNVFVSNSNTPESVLKDIATSYNNDISDELHREIIKHPNCPEELKEIFRRTVHKNKIDKLKNYVDKSKKLPNIDYENKTMQPIHGKANTDLELLKRLKGYINNVG